MPALSSLSTGALFLSFNSIMNKMPVGGGKLQLEVGFTLYKRKEDFILWICCWLLSYEEVFSVLRSQKMEQSCTLDFSVVLSTVHVCVSVSLVLPIINQSLDAEIESSSFTSGFQNSRHAHSCDIVCGSLIKYKMQEGVSLVINYSIEPVPFHVNIVLRLLIPSPVKMKHRADTFYWT